MVDYTRRSIVLGTAGIAAAGAGVTAAASGLSGSVEGQADVQAEQALTVTGVSISESPDASFTRVSDDNTEFQAAAELNNGDTVGFDVTIENSAQDDFDVQIAIDAVEEFDITVGNSARDNGADGAVRTGEETFISTIGDGSTTINIDAELDDTADPGSYDIGVAINPLSTDN